MNFFYINFIVSFILFSSTLFASETIVIDNNSKIYTLETLDFFRTQTDSLSINEIVKIHSNNKFKSFDSLPERLEDGTKFWIHFKIKNISTSENHWVLNFNSMISSVDVYTISKLRSDTVFTHYESVNNYHQLKIPLSIFYDDLVEFYIKINRDIAFPATLKKCRIKAGSLSLQDFILHSSISGSLLGVLLLLFIYSILKLINYRSKVYFYYLGYVFFHIIFILHGSYLMEYVIVQQNQLQFFSLLLSFSYGIVFYIFFVKEFIGNDNFPVKIDRWFYTPYTWLVIIANILLTVVSFVDIHLFNILFFRLPVLYGLFGVLLVVLLIVKIKHPIVQLVLYGTLITVLTGVLSIVFDEILIFENNLTYNIGIVAGVLFYAFALSKRERYNIEAVNSKELHYKNLEDDMAEKQRLLTSKALLISQQEQLLSELQVQFKELKKTDSVNVEQLSSIFSTMERHSNYNAWDEFERYFVEVHPSFYEKIKQLYPDITQNELRLCSLLKLNMNTKQIADITKKTPKSIDVMRSRIRQKMGLSRDESLFDNISEL